MDIFEMFDCGALTNCCSGDPCPHVHEHICCCYCIYKYECLDVPHECLHYKKPEDNGFELKKPEELVDMINSDSLKNF